MKVEISPQLSLPIVVHFFLLLGFLQVLKEGQNMAWAQ
jgi:hypothetical protein